MGSFTVETISRLIDRESPGIVLTELCSNGLDAYDMIIDESPDIVMTDIKMPGMGGLDLIKKINEANPDTRFIILSDYGEFEYAKEAMKYGVKHYISKPCNEKQIREAVWSSLTQLHESSPSALLCAPSGCP